MPKCLDGNIPQGAGSFSFSPARLDDVEGKTEIKNIESLIKRLENYTKNGRGFARPSWGYPPIRDISLEMFCPLVECIIKNTVNSEPYKTTIYELNQYLMRKISYQINYEKIVASYNFKRGVNEIIPLIDEYVDELYKSKEIQQGDRFEKSAIILNILYLMSMADYVQYMNKEIKENGANVSYLWRYVYEIAVLQGRICLIESHVDTDMIDIHHKSRSSKAKDADWKKKHAKMDEDNQKLDKRLIKPIQHAKDLWEKSHKPIYHNQMADKIDENKTLGIDRQILIEKLKPIARGYRYSTFCRGEFKRPLDITSLCQSISTDNYKIKIHSTQNTIDWLNEIIMTPDFYSKWFKKKGDIDLSPELDELIGDTHSCRKKKFTEFTEEEQIKIKRLNRLLLEHTYPRTPKSLKHGLMKGWEGKKKED